MNEFIELFLFSLFPFFVSLFISITISPLGAALYIRNEILYGISLPPVGMGAIALLLLFGLSDSMHWLLHLIAAFIIFLVTTFLSQSEKFQAVSHKRREMELASFFIFGHTFTYLMMAWSTHVNQHLEYLLKGEMLTIHRQEFFYYASLLTMLFVFTFLNRRNLFAFIIDEEFYSLSTNNSRFTNYNYKMVLAIGITGAVVFSGSLFTTALLVLPTLFTISFTQNIRQLFIFVILFSLSTTLCGFLLALWLDMPPVYIIILTMLLAGISLHGIISFLIRTKKEDHQEDSSLI